MTDTPRFLITSSDKRSWRYDSPILFLGSWCLQDEKLEALEKFDTAVVPPYGWEDGQKERDYEYTRALTERLLVEISDSLNRYHGISHSNRYWRILVGTWLNNFTRIMFNRWATIHFALSQYNISETIVPDFQKEQLIPYDFNGFSRLFRLEPWNQVVYGMILQGWTDVPCVSKALGPLDEGEISDKKHFTSMPSKGLFSPLKKFSVDQIERLAYHLGRSTDAFLIHTYLPRIQELKLNLMLGQLPVKRVSRPVPEIRPDMESRSGFFRTATSSSKDFDDFIRTVIAEQMPTCYLEGYQALSECADNMPWPARPRFIFTANAFDGDEVFKVWTAGNVERGTPYIIAQHGANYGTGQYAPSEVHEKLTADRYLTWGWSDDCPSLRPTVALPLVGKCVGVWSPEGGIVLVERGDLSRMAAIWDESLVFKAYLEDQLRFVGQLQLDIQKQVLVRLYAANLYPRGPEEALWKKRFQDINIDPGVSSIDKLIGQSRLTVYTYDSTGILESLQRNLPTIIFWNLAHWPLRREAKRFYDQLKTVGILHSSPESAAEQINEVWQDVGGWWYSQEVQEVRKAFCDRFVRMPEHPLEELKNALTEPFSGLIS